MVTHPLDLTPITNKGSLQTASFSQNKKVNLAFDSSSKGTTIENASSVHENSMTSGFFPLQRLTPVQSNERLKALAKIHQFQTHQSLLKDTKIDDKQEKNSYFKSKNANAGADPGTQYSSGLQLVTQSDEQLLTTNVTNHNSN